MLLASPAPRFLLAAPFAAAVALGLAGLMRLLIAEPEVTADPPRAPAPDLQIVSTLVDTAPDGPTPPAPPSTITPPDPVVIERPTGGDGPPAPGPRVFVEPKVETQAPQGSVAIAAPPIRLYTPLPEIPSSVRDPEGSCVVRFDVEPSGRTSNVRAIRCTEAAFAGAAERAVRGTIYQPAQGEAGPVGATGLTLEIAYQIAG